MCALLKYRGLAIHKHKSHPSGTLPRLNPTNDSEMSQNCRMMWLLMWPRKRMDFRMYHIIHCKVDSYTWLLAFRPRRFHCAFENINMSWEILRVANKQWYSDAKKKEYNILSNCKIHTGKCRYLRLPSRRVVVAFISKWVSRWFWALSLCYKSGFMYCKENSWPVATNWVSKVKIHKRTSRSMCNIQMHTIARLQVYGLIMTKTKQGFCHMCCYLPKTSRMILGMDANDIWGVLNSDFTYNNKTLYNKSQYDNLWRCTLFHAGRYIFDTHESGVSEYMVPFEERYHNVWWSFRFILWDFNFCKSWQN